MDIKHSRTLRLADGVSEKNEDSLKDKFERSIVAVAVGDNEHAVRTAEVLIDTLRRMPIRLTLVGNPSEFTKNRLVEVANAIDPARGLGTDPIDGPDVVVAIDVNNPSATLTGTPVHHGALVVTGSHEPRAADFVSGLGIFTCAALLAGEVFKRIAEVLPDRMALPDRISWCPVTLSDDPWATPNLKWPSDHNLALIGLGAIGTATIRILDLLEVMGKVQLVDPERFEPENLGTYSLGTSEAAALKPRKVDLAAAALPRMNCETFAGTAAEYIQEIDKGKLNWPTLVLTGLDSPEARREVQRVWPDRLIDGATGDTTCGIHDISYGERCCLICLFPEEAVGPTAAEQLAKATGLPIETVIHGNEILNESDLENLDDEKQQLIRPMLGKPICGLADAVGLTKLDADFRPSIPFVSQQAACMVVGRALVGEPSTLPNFVQYDALIGPAFSTKLDRDSILECYCQSRQEILVQVRRTRAAETGVENGR